MTIIIFIIVFLVFFLSVRLRLLILNPFKTFFYLFSDILKYIRKYKYIPKKPFINVYVGLFGQGKTLSAVHDCISFYNEYNNRKVWDDRFDCFVTQKVFILSNVSLKGVPYRYFHSLTQLQNISKWRHITDKKHHTRTITICLLDECSTIFNSRQFKTFPTPFIKTLLTSRHCLIHGFYLTSQRFGHMDALLRQVSTNVIECKKTWRLCVNTYYDAWAYENCSRPSECPVSSITGFFVEDKHFRMYDTLAVVQEINKQIDDNSFESDKDILDRQGQKPFNISVQKKKKK